MATPVRIQHYFVTEHKGALLIRQAQHAEGKRGAMFALAMLGLSCLVGPYGPFALDAISPEIFFVGAGGFAISAAVGFYFSTYEKRWLIEPRAMTVRSSASATIAKYPINSGTVVETDETHYLGPGTDLINAFPYTLTITFDSGHAETLKFTNRPAGERVLAMIRKLLPELRITGCSQIRCPSQNRP